MRYGLISDVHGNLPALEAVVQRLSAEGVDAYICAGDLVGYGPFPNECVDRVLGLPGAVCVAGNHDLIVVGSLAPNHSDVIVRESHEWMAAVLAPGTIELLEGLPQTARTPDGLVVAHGSLRSPEQYVPTPARATEQLAQLREDDPSARVLILGHTHHALLVDDRGCAPEAAGRVALAQNRRYVINPGAVGQSREPALHARGAIVDVDCGEARFVTVEYDTALVRAALRRHGLSRHAIHAPPRPAWRVTAGRLRRRLAVAPSWAEVRRHPRYARGPD